MPDVVPDGETTGPLERAEIQLRRYHRSRTLRHWLIAAAIAASTVAVLALGISLATNWQVTHRNQVLTAQALADAQAATRRANAAAAAAVVAAAHAEDAHDQAERALAQSRATRVDLCVFLTGVILHAQAEERADARDLARAYRCPTSRT
jgi:hypothetical protein